MAFPMSNCTTAAVAASAYPVKRNNPLTTAVNGLLEERETGIEPATTSLGSNDAPVISDDSKALTSTPLDACTCACTSEPENDNADTQGGAESSGALSDDPGLQEVVRTWPTLPEPTRRKLVALVEQARDG